MKIVDSISTYNSGLIIIIACLRLERLTTTPTAASLQGQAAALRYYEDGITAPRCIPIIATPMIISS